MTRSAPVSATRWITRFPAPLRGGSRTTTSGRPAVRMSSGMLARTSPQEKPTLAIPLRAAFCRAASTAAGEISTPYTYPACQIRQVLDPLQEAGGLAGVGLEEGLQADAEPQTVQLLHDVGPAREDRHLRQREAVRETGVHAVDDAGDLGERRPQAGREVFQNGHLGGGRDDPHHDLPARLGLADDQLAEDAGVAAGIVAAQA